MNAIQSDSDTISFIIPSDCTDYALSDTSNIRMSVLY